MSRVHSPSQYPGRTGGPPYCTFCQADWPCAGHAMENADARAAATSREAGHGSREVGPDVEPLSASREAGLDAERAVVAKALYDSITRPLGCQCIACERLDQVRWEIRLASQDRSPVTPDGPDPNG